MIPKWVFPSISILLNCGSAIVCACHGDFKRAIYWAAAAVLTATVTV